MHVVECAAAETRDQAPSRTTAMFAWDPYAAFFPGGGDDVTRAPRAGPVGGVAPADPTVSAGDEISPRESGT